MKYKAKFPLTNWMSPVWDIVSDRAYESKEEEALWHYNSSRAHDGLPPLDRLPHGVTFEPLPEQD